MYIKLGGTKMGYETVGDYRGTLPDADAPMAFFKRPRGNVCGICWKALVGAPTRQEALWGGKVEAYHAECEEQYA